MTDIESQVYWTLPMTLAWVASGDIDVVSQWSQQESFTAVLLHTINNDALQLIVERLASGELPVTAVRASDGEALVIPVPEWAYLEIWDEKDGVALGHTVKSLGPTVVYLSPKVRRETVLRLWPLPQPIKTRSDEVRCEQYLEVIVAKSPDAPTLAKADFLADAKAKFNVSERGAIRIWDDCVAARPAWRKRGPKGPRKGSAAAIKG